MCWGQRDFWEWKTFSSLKNKNRSRKIEARETNTFGIGMAPMMYVDNMVP